MLKQLLIVALLSMTPWGEWAVAVPAGLLMDLPFIPILITAFAGNLMPVLLICFLWGRIKGRLTNWHQKRQHKAQSVLKRYGILGLILLAPVSIGVYISSITSLLSGISAKRTVLLHIYSLILWAVVITVLYRLGLKVWDLFPL